MIESNPEAGHPFDRLTPDVVLDALASVGLRGDGRLQALSSYENRVYQVHLEDGQQVVAKFYRPARWTQAQILEEHAFADELMAAEVPVVGPLRLQAATLHAFAGFWFCVAPRRGGRAPELDDEEVLEWIGRFLARLHLVGQWRPFEVRPALDLQSYGLAARDWLLANDFVSPEVRSQWRQACDEALNLVKAHTVLTGQDSPLRKLRLHGDCHPGNILWTPMDAPAAADPGPHFVDLDDARMGPAVQDLWMLLSGERAQQTYQLSCLLQGYELIRDFDRRELSLIEPLRTLRMIHYSAWLAQRWDDPAFPRNFPWFGSTDYWREQLLALHEQIEAMQQPALMA